MVREEEKIKLDLAKNYRTSQYIWSIPYIRNENRNFKNSVIDIINNRSELIKFLFATSDYGKNNQENINAVVAALDEKGKGVFESPIPLSVTFKDQKNFDIQNPIIGNLLSQVNANKISDAKVKQLLGQAKDEELQARRLD